MVSCFLGKHPYCLPDAIPCENLAEWNTYLSSLYPVFVQSIRDASLTFMGKPLRIRREPWDGDYEHAFVHLTHRDYFHTDDPNDRQPDPDRSERLPWVGSIISHYDCVEHYSCPRILYWEHRFRGYVRSNLLYDSERFLVVIEQRKAYCLLITGFYLNDEDSYDRQLRRYRQYQKQKTPLA